MPRLQKIQPSEATGGVREMYDDLEAQLGGVPNIFQGLANSPAGLGGYLALDKLIAEGELGQAEQEIVRLVVSQHNGCHYCLAAHTRAGEAKGLDQEAMLDVRRGQSGDPDTRALVTFTRRVLENRGNVTDGDLADFREAGYTDAHVVEVLTIIAQKTLSNYFNHVNQTELDFPSAPSL